MKNIIKFGKIIGPGNIQCILNKKRCYFIEINTRFAAGGLPLTVASGVNIPLICIKLMLGHKIQKNIDYITNLRMIRFLTEIIR